MKNLVISLLLGLILLSCSTSNAETPDLSSFSYMELLELRQQVDFAIAQTGEWKQVVIPPGEYIVGIDIPAGSYAISLEGNLSDIEVYSDGKRVHDHCLTDSDRIGKLPLQDGQVVRIKYGNLIFAPYRGLGF